MLKASAATAAAVAILVMSAREGFVISTNT